MNVAGLTAEAVTNLVIEPAEIQILLDNTQPIIRVASTADTPLDEMEPVDQIVVAQVSWPDNHPREVAAAALLIDNEDPLPIETCTLNTNNQMEFTWDISELDAGEYELILQLTDELGLVAESVPLAFTVEIERPVVEAAVPETSATIAVPEVTAETTEEETTASSFLTEQAGIIGIVLGILAILFALFLVVVAFVFFRRRSAAAPAPVPAPAPVHAAYSPEPAPDATQILMPAFAIQSAAATLEALEYAADHPQPVPLTGNDITIGQHPGAPERLLPSLHVLGHCVMNETFASAFLEASLAAAQGPVTQAAVRELLSDEIDHARIGWAYLASATAQLRSELQPWLLDVAQANLRMWRQTPRAYPTNPRVVEQGAPSALLVEQALGAGLRDLIVPRLEHLGFDVSGLHAWLDAGAPT